MGILIQKTMATNPKLFEIADKLSKLTVLEAKELIRILEEDFEIKAPESTGIVYVGDAPTPHVVEQTEFNVYLKEIGPQKLQLVKAVKEATGLGLKESKELVDSAPCLIKEKILKAECDIIKTALENVGAIVEVR